MTPKMRTSLHKKEDAQIKFDANFVGSDAIYLLYWISP